MSDHYFSEKPKIKSGKKQINEEIHGHSFDFHVDHGVFSKGGMDFGTRLLIETYQEPEITGSIADVGCGWGPIGISLAKTNPDRHVYMVDINERSVELSRENVRLNGVGNVTVAQNNILDGFDTIDFAAVVTNPPIRAGKDVVFSIYEQAKRVLKQHGEIWIVIQKKQGAASTQRKLVELGFEVTVENKQKGYFIFRGKKID
ncbi:16S rRNA methyltransferase [Salipaludibacillus keqinensis]|uniref:16S rRNA methyltransferase n=1 Tax=Salipaludibacillus keqinensis TaxID=2045207 RepID=A0A323TD94_9BACI|nr:class I SAM-dependent methyltransferase [Salipaludibacillus keqinensis]PYZ91847.1 16S rRNA methyltransferase [Salipaludibacillus keqinensis]